MYVISNFDLFDSEFFREEENKDLRAMEIQARIRRNAEECASHMSDLQTWQKKIEFKDKINSKKQSLKKEKAPVRSGIGTVSVRGSEMRNHSSVSANKHPSNVEMNKTDGGKHSFPLFYCSQQQQKIRRLLLLFK